MEIPTHGRYVLRRYCKDGTRLEEPHGYGGDLCHRATQPYDARQGYVEKTPTEEAERPPYTERETAEGERESA